MENEASQKKKAEQTFETCENVKAHHIEKGEEEGEGERMKLCCVSK